MVDELLDSGILPELTKHRRLLTSWLLKPNVGLWHGSDAADSAELFCSAPIHQMPTCSATARASSASMPRQRTMLSIFLCPTTAVLRSHCQCNGGFGSARRMRPNEAWVQPDAGDPMGGHLGASPRRYRPISTRQPLKRNSPELLLAAAI
jgi:hypothetical protein